MPVTGGYKLTTDVVCDFDWATSNQVLNLNHLSLTGYFLPSGTGQTIKNGTIYATQTEYWGEFHELHRLESQDHPQGWDVHRRVH